MSGTDPTTPHPTESGVPVPEPPATVPSAQRPAPAVHVAGSAQAAPDDAPTSLMPALGAPTPPATHDRADATRVAAPLRPVAGDSDPTGYLSPTANPAPSAAPVPTRTPSYSARRAPATPPAGPYGGLYADPLAVHVGTVPYTGAQDDAQATRVAGQLSAPPPPAAATQPSAPRPVAPSSAPRVAAPSAQPAPAVPPSPVGDAQPVPAPAAPGQPVPRRATAALGRPEPRVMVLGGVVGVLVVVAFVLGFTLFGGSDSPAATPSAGASSSAGTGTAAQPVVSEQFASPSRNISCTVTASEATCGIASLAKKPTPVEGCDGTVGYVAKVAADGTVTTPCVPRGGKPKAAAKSVHVLDYGESVTVGKVACTSSETGVRCLDKSTGKGFTIARAGIGGV